MFPGLAVHDIGDPEPAAFEFAVGSVDDPVAGLVPAGV
jgi:hypothetical protein